MLILIAILVVGGILWFDKLGIIDAKNAFAPFYNRIGKAGRTGPEPPAGEMLDIDAERFAVLVEALELRNRELGNREQDIMKRQGEIEQMAQELEVQRKALEDQIKTFNARLSEADTKDRNVEQNARNLTGMPPQRAVGILAAMDDQDVIDVLRKTEQIAQAEGNSSIVPFWLSLMEPERAAEINRKMVSRPPGLN
jgi:flagellar protein FlbB